MKLTFQEKFEQFEVWDGVDIVPDAPDGDFVRFKITDAKRQIKVTMHKRHFALFLKSMEGSEVNLITSNNCVSGNEANPKNLQSGEVALPTALHIWNNGRGMSYESFKEWWTITVGNDR